MVNWPDKTNGTTLLKDLGHCCQAQKNDTYKDMAKKSYTYRALYENESHLIMIGGVSKALPRKEKNGRWPIHLSYLYCFLAVVNETTNFFFLLFRTACYYYFTNPVRPSFEKVTKRAKRVQRDS